MSHDGPPPPGPPGPQGPQGPLQGPPSGHGPPQGAYGVPGDGPPPQGPGDDVWTIHPYEPPPPPKRSKAPVIIAISTAVALIAAGGGFAFVQADPFNLFGSGPQPAEVLPATAFAYAAIDLDPAASQKVDAIRFLNHFPGFTDNVDLTSERDDVRDDILSEALDELDCAGVSYDETIKPWLGLKLGVAVVPSADGEEPDPIFAVEVTDAGAAQEGLEALNDCDDAEGGAGFAFSGDYVLLAQTRSIAERAVADAEDAALADDGNFKADMNSLGELGIAAGWMDTGKLIDLLPAAELPDQTSVEALGQAAGRYAATFRFDHDSAELVSSVHADYAEVETGPNEVVDLPGSTAFALSASGGGQQLEANWDKIIESAESSGVDVEAALADFENETGFSIPADLQTLLGDNLLMAVSSDGLTVDAVETGDFEQTSAGVRFTGDADKLQDLYDRLISFGRDTFGVELPVSKVDFEDGLVIATNDEYAETLSALDGNLGDSPTFQSVVDDAADQDAVVYLDFDAIEDVVIEAMESSGSAGDSVANVKPLRAFGVTGGYEDGYAISTARLSVND